MFGLGYIFKITLLLVNAVAILNEERFLARSAYLMTSMKSLRGLTLSLGALQLTHSWVVHRW